MSVSSSQGLTSNRIEDLAMSAGSAKRGEVHNHGTKTPHGHVLSNRSLTYSLPSWQCNLPAAAPLSWPSLHPPAGKKAREHVKLSPLKRRHDDITATAPRLNQTDPSRRRPHPSRKLQGLCQRWRQPHLRGRTDPGASSHLED